jgi:membrane associated rhomboid family serine protease
MAYRGSSPTVVWLLIAVNLMLFVVRIVNTDLAFNLGLYPPEFWDRPWTLVSSMFIHANFWHILANMITLYFFGSFLNRLIGVKRLLLVYFAGGILGGIIFLLLPPSEPAVAVGASGAIFALGGVLAVMRPRLRVLVFPIPAPLPLWIAIIGIFVILSFLPDIAWQAHLGGLVFGMVAGYFFRRRERYFYT